MKPRSSLMSNECRNDRAEFHLTDRQADVYTDLLHTTYGIAAEPCLE